MRKWLFGSRRIRVQVVGGEGCGKTTFLYTLKYNGKPYVDPSSVLDYNFETIEYPGGWEFLIYDVWSGCSRFVLSNGHFHFMSPETLVWYIHDCTNNEADMMFCPQHLDAMKEKGSKYIWCILSKQDLLPHEKRDNIVAKHRAKIETIFRQKADPEGIKWFIVADPGWNLKKGDFVRPFVKGVAQKIAELDREKELDYHEAGDNPGFKIPSDEELRTTVESADIKDAAEFWEIFLAAYLTSWNHLDHLQAGYLVMLQSIEQKHGMLNCVSAFLDHLTRLRAARPDVFRNTTHFTMTAFWIIQLRIATFNFQYNVNDGEVPTGNDFRSIVMHTPSLLFTHLWTLSYTKRVLFTPQARKQFVMPDLQPFPQVPKPLLESLAQGMDDAQDDEEHLGMFELPDTRYIGPDRLPRWAFETVQNVLKNDIRLGAAVKDSLAEFQADTIRLRAKYPKLADDDDVPPYSETQAYFWIRHVHGLLSALNSEPGDNGKSLSSHTVVESLSFEQFQETSRIDASVWELHYSQSLWESVGARMKFVNPDKKPLPNNSGLLRRMSSYLSSWFALREGGSL